MKKVHFLIYFFLAAAFLCSCSSVQVTANKEASADFSKYLTYNIAKPKPNPRAPVIFSTINQNRLSHAIAHEMELRDYKRADHPDLMVSYYLKVKEQTDVYSTGGYYGYHRGGQTNTYHYKVGTLIIDFVDVKNHKLVWQGVAVGVLKKNQKNIEERIQNVVNKIMKEYVYLAGTNTPVAKKDK